MAPAPVNRDDLAASAALLDQIVDVAAHIPGPELRLVVEQLGVIVVSGNGAQIRYHREIAGFVPAPAVIAFTNAPSPHRSRYMATYAGQPTKRNRQA